MWYDIYITAIGLTPGGSITHLTTNIKQDTKNGKQDTENRNRDDEEKDVGSYWMTLRKREDTLI
jgi:hypothetical protein